MIVIQNSVFKQYLATLKEREVAPSLHADYTKWLRYYLNFCDMYQVRGDNHKRLGLFMEKLNGKHEPEEQRQLALHAVSLFFESQEPTTADLDGDDTKASQVSEMNAAGPESEAMPVQVHQSARGMRVSQYNDAGYQVSA